MLIKTLDKNGLNLQPGDRATAYDPANKVWETLLVLPDVPTMEGRVWVKILGGKCDGQTGQVVASVLVKVEPETENQTAKAVGNAAKVCAQCVVGIAAGLLFGTAKALADTWKESQKEIEPKFNPQLPTRCAPISYSRPGQGSTGNIFIINGGNVTVNNF